MQRGKYSLIVELKYLNGNNSNKEFCTADDKKMLEDVATNIVQSEGVRKIIRFQFSLEDKPVSGFLGFQRNAYIISSDQVEEI